mmetsp:Transcript_152852/g.281783  ORF Transcript_152852/g.281783 Transcript_152852/m.281783 type:complete len:508 (-) Transcript_152852:79-1602(-)
MVLDFAADVTPLRNDVGTSQTVDVVGTPELWEFYERLITDSERGRVQIFEHIENLRLPVEDVHRVEWEKKQRLVEISDLELQLKDAERKLVSHQAELLRVTETNDNIRAQAPQWEADLEHARAILRPRVEGVRFSAGAQPEKIGCFAPTVTSSAPRGLGKRDDSLGAGPEQVQRSPLAEIRQPNSGPGPVIMEYVPNDREEVNNAHLKSLQERLQREREGHAAARDQLEELQRCEEEENALLLHMLQEQTKRAREQRDHIRLKTDEVMRWHVRLRQEDESLRNEGDKEMNNLRDSNNFLAQRLQSVSMQGHDAREKASQDRQQLNEKASWAHISGLLRARENAAMLHDEIDVAEEGALSKVDDLEKRLEALRARYDGLVRHRAAEIVQLRQDVQRLQHATRQCELIATRCLNLPTLSLFSSGRLGRTSAGAATSNLEALALRPAVQRLRSILERCEAALHGEEGQCAPRRASQVQAFSDAGHEASSGEASHTESTAMQPSAELPVLQ